MFDFEIEIFYEYQPLAAFYWIYLMMYPFVWEYVKAPKVVTQIKSYHAHSQKSKQCDVTHGHVLIMIFWGGG